MKKNDIAKLNLPELIWLSNQFDQKGLLREANFCDKLANHIDKLGMARRIPDDLAEQMEGAAKVKVVPHGEKERGANYTELTDLVGDSMNNRITMAAEELTRIPSFSVQKKGHKPAGIWYACGNEWLSWLTYEMPQWIGDYVYSLKVNEARILMIKTEKEFYNFERKYLVQGEDYPGQGNVVDWAKVASEYDGIEICPYQGGARYSSNWYYGWDVASGCIWDGAAVTEAVLVAHRTGEAEGRERSPESDEEANWEWYGLGAGSESSVSSKDPEEIAAEVSERVGEGEESDLNPLDPMPTSVKEVMQKVKDQPYGEPWAKPWQDGGVSPNTVTDKPYHGGRGQLFDYPSTSQPPVSLKGVGGKTAESVKILEGWNGEAILYQLNEPLNGHEYVVVSAASTASGPETYIFGANAEGEVEGWTELRGSTPGIECHTTALKNAGYKVV
jgi:hypothetical protein